MGHELTVSCVTSGRLDDETGSYDIRDGSLSVADTETAYALVERYPSLSWADGPPSDADSAAHSGDSGGEDTPADVSGGDDLTELTGVGPKTDDALHEAGYESFDALANTDAATVADDVDGLSETDVEDLHRQLES